MSTQDLEETLTPIVRTMQVIVVALFLGTATFTGIAIFLRMSGNMPPGGGPDIVSSMAIAFAAGAFVAAWVVPSAIERASLSKIARGTWQPRGGPTAPAAQMLEKLGEAGPLAVLYPTKTIVAGAILEGAAFFNNIAYLIEGSLATLAAAVLLAVGVLAQFPTRARVVTKIEEQLRRLAEEKALGAK